jgi:hypothetical protein
MEASGGADEVFEVSADAETVAAKQRFEGANVCRAAAISAMLGGHGVAVADVAEPLGELGFDARMLTPSTLLDSRYRPRATGSSSAPRGLHLQDDQPSFAIFTGAGLPTIGAALAHRHAEDTWI